MSKSMDRLWRDRAILGKSRWTPDELLKWELVTLSEFASVGGKILDLGSGDGTLSRALAAEWDAQLEAVDSTAEFSRFFDSQANQQFTKCDVRAYEFQKGQADLVLLLGVVNYLSGVEEIQLLKRIAPSLNLLGTLVVKHQCAFDQELNVNGYSKELGMIYEARYPSIDQQTLVLTEFFNSVQLIEYPSIFQTHSNSHHFMFICRFPII